MFARWHQYHLLLQCQGWVDEKQELLSLGTTSHVSIICLPSPGPSPSVLAQCKRSNTVGGNGWEQGYQFCTSTFQQEDIFTRTYQDKLKGHDSDAHLPEPRYKVVAIPNATRLLVASLWEAISHRLHPTSNGLDLKENEPVKAMLTV